jgi:pimeloyl-ACP methyl ester carboxylesterase
MAAGKYAHVNGLDLYYEVHGKGQPLVLLHGGLGSVEMFSGLLPVLAKTRQVVAVELQGHGHTADVDQPFRFEQMADDVAALAGQLKLGPVDLLGYSLGGGAAWQVAARHPEAVRKLIVVSSPFRRDGWYPEVLAGMAALNAGSAAAMAGSPPHQAYTRVAPRPEDWPNLVAKTGELLGRDYDWSKAMAAFGMPCLLVFGDADSVRPAHVVEMFGLLGGGQKDAGWDGSGMSRSRLAILPATTHYEILASPLLPAVLTSFLDAPMPAGDGR